MMYNIALLIDTRAVGMINDIILCLEGGNSLR